MYRGGRKREIPTLHAWALRDRRRDPNASVVGQQIGTPTRGGREGGLPKVAASQTESRSLLSVERAGVLAFSFMFHVHVTTLTQRRKVSVDHTSVL